MAGAGAIPFVENKLHQRKVILFAKSFVPECKTVRGILDTYQIAADEYEVCEIECRQDCTQIENYLQIICLTNTRSMPQLFVNAKYVGGEADIRRLHEQGKLNDILEAIDDLPAEVQDGAVPPDNATVCVQ